MHGPPNSFDQRSVARDGVGEAAAEGIAGSRGIDRVDGRRRDVGQDATFCDHGSVGTEGDHDPPCEPERRKGVFDCVERLRLVRAGQHPELGAMEVGKGCAGAGLRITTPPTSAIAATTAGSGTSSWNNATRAAANTGAAAVMALTGNRAFAPGLTTMAFSPASSRVITASPLPASASTET